MCEVYIYIYIHTCYMYIYICRSKLHDNKGIKSKKGEMEAHCTL